MLILCSKLSNGNFHVTNWEFSNLKSSGDDYIRSDECHVIAQTLAHFLKTRAMIMNFLHNKLPAVMDVVCCAITPLQSLRTVLLAASTYSMSKQFLPLQNNQTKITKNSNICTYIESAYRYIYIFVGFLRNLSGSEYIALSHLDA